MVSQVYKKFSKNFLYNRVHKNMRPQLASIEVTRRCNSKCSFCPIGTEKAEIHKTEMTTEQIFDVLDQLDEVGIIAFSFLGGEPTLRKDIVEIGHHARKRNIISQLTTNGLLVPKRAYDYTEAIDALVISLDTTDPVKYKELRGVDAFDTVVDAIKSCVDYAEENDCSVISNTVICAKNIEEIPDVVKFCHSLGVNGIMLDFATFHDYWTEIVEEDSTYKPEEMDWRNDTEGVKRLVHQILEMKKEYPILTSRSYLETFLSGDFFYKCNPSIFACVNRKGEIAIPCWDSAITQYYSLLNGQRLKDLWFSDEVIAAKEAVTHCRDCYMHCIVEPSKVLGSPGSNLGDLLEWAKAFKKGGMVG